MRREASRKPSIAFTNSTPPNFRAAVATDPSNQRRDQPEIRRENDQPNAAPAVDDPTTGRDTAPKIACTHCGEIVPPSLLRSDETKQFCCRGCRTAHEVIVGCGLDRYYALRDGAAQPARSSTGRDYGEFDDASFRERHVRPLPDGLAGTELFLDGIHCAACLWLVERLPKIVPGVLESRLDLRRSLVRLTWDEKRVRLAEIGRTLDRLGYAPHPARATTAREARRREERRQLIRIGVAGACAGNVMLLAFALYAGLFAGMDPFHQSIFRWLSMGLSLVAIAWPGSVFFKGAWTALRSGVVRLDLPIAVGLGAGAIWGTINTVRGSGEIYFDTLSVLVLALLVGRYLQQRQQRWSADAVELLFSLTSSRATLIDESDDSARSVPVERVQSGDLVLVAAGESVPVDGVVESGRSTVDRSLLTGESIPVPIDVGDAIPAGAVNVASPLRVRVEATGEETRIGRLMRTVEEAAQRRAPVVRMADRIAGWFTVTALSLASLTVLLWWRHGPTEAIEHAVALLIITCPCGLGLATPLAMTVATGRAARARILVKGGDAIERLAAAKRRGRRGLVMLDKTGTATEGRLSVVSMHGDRDALPLAAAAERLTVHPVADAIRRHADGAASSIPAESAVTDRHVVTGGGVSALIDETRVVVGSPVFVTSVARMSSPLAAALQEVDRRGLTPVLVAIDGAVRLVIALDDPLRSDAISATRRLENLGWEVAMLSGDQRGVVDRIGAEMGIPASLRFAAVTPERKLALIETSTKHRPTVMVGDGVNDSAALAAATVGVAVHGGAEASLAAADAHLGRPGLGPVVELLEGARRTMWAVRRNLAVSLAYNATTAAFAMAGMISPLAAAIIMPISSLTIVFLSVHARTFDAPPSRRSTHLETERPR